MAMIVRRSHAEGEVLKAWHVFSGCLVKLVRLLENDVWEFEEPISATFLLADGTTQQVDLIGIEDEYLMPLDPLASVQEN